MSDDFETPFIPVQIRSIGGRDFTVRKSELADFGALVQMYKSFEPKGVAQGLPPRELRRIAHWLARLHDKARALMAVEGERVVAHAILCPISEASVEYTIFIHQDFRRQGVGTALSRLAVEWARQAGRGLLCVMDEMRNPTGGAPDGPPRPDNHLRHQVNTEILSYAPAWTGAADPAVTRATEARIGSVEPAGARIRARTPE